MNSRVILYSVNHLAYYQRMAAYSILSLRHHSPRAVIKICVFGKLHSFLMSVIKSNKVDLILMPNMDIRLGTSLKWIAFSKVRSVKSLLWVDADTLFMEPVETVFAAHKTAPIYAESERATEGPWRRGNKTIGLRIIKSKMDKLRKSYNSKKEIVPFTGFVLFNNYSLRFISNELPIFFDIYRKIMAGEIAYPCTMPIMIDEIIGSIILGRVNLKVSPFRPGTITHFNDWSARPEQSLGKVLHIGNSLMASCFKFFGHSQDALKLNILKKSRDQKILPRAVQKSLGSRR